MFNFVVPYTSYTATPTGLQHQLGQRHNTEIPTLKDLIIVSHNVRMPGPSLIFRLGRALGIRASTLRSLRSNIGHDYESNHYFVEVMQVWLEESTRPTWEALVEALKSEGLHRIANYIEREYLMFC